jgi:hypothetical protein
MAGFHFHNWPLIGQPIQPCLSNWVSGLGQSRSCAALSCRLGHWRGRGGALGSIDAGTEGEEADREAAAVARYLLRSRTRFLGILYAFKIAEDMRRRLIVQPHDD